MSIYSRFSNQQQRNPEEIPHHKAYDAPNGVANQERWPVHKFCQEVEQLISPELGGIAQDRLV